MPRIAARPAFQINAEQAAKRNELAAEFPTISVENLSVVEATTSVLSEPIFPPVPPFSGLSGGKIGVAGDENTPADARHLSTQVAAGQSVAVSGELIDAGQGDGQGARLNHHQGESGGGKIIECG